jgi:hypothetical protein
VALRREWHEHDGALRLRGFGAHAGVCWPELWGACSWIGVVSTGDRLFGFPTLCGLLDL